MRGPSTAGLCLLAVTTCLSQAASGNGLLQRQNPLATITSLRCHFIIKTSVLWTDGKPNVRQEPTDVRVTVSEVDLQDGTAEISSPQGRRFASALLSDGSLYFMETTSGAMDVTAVFATQSSRGKLRAVRGEYAYVYLTVPPFVPDPAVSQSYGECEPAPGA